ncbi:hypothetical protein AGMMS49941_10840 [Deferribacterales bacterium]|nr:hypothetical protein AGMMS49941_10840 [Deferribacterales bacterium]
MNDKEKEPKYQEFLNIKETSDKDSNKRWLLEKAWHVRDFEIGMSWRRAIYFVGFISALFIGYINLKTNKQQCDYPYLYLILTAGGLLVSYIWYLVNRASKQIYENWEHHIDYLENDIGELYKTVIHKNYSFWSNPLGGYPISPSKANTLLSILMCFGWLILFGIELPKQVEINLDIPTIILLGGIIVLLLVLLFGITYWLKTTDMKNKENKDDEDKLQAHKRGLKDLEKESN